MNRTVLDYYRKWIFKDTKKCHHKYKAVCYTVWIFSAILCIIVYFLLYDYKTNCQYICSLVIVPFKETTYQLGCGYFKACAQELGINNNMLLQLQLD